MKSYKREDCRLCDSKNLSRVLNLTPTPPADSYIPRSQLGVDRDVIPLDLYQCQECGHVQIGHVIDAEEVYLNYIYETASTLGLDGHFKACADDIMKTFKPREGGLVIDVGSNDGCLLGCFKDYGMNVLGIDPMPGIAEKASARGIPTIADFFSEKLADELKTKYGVASVITSNNLVADTDNLTEFVKCVSSLMDQDSIFFFETFYLYLQIKNHVWDFTYHEHYSYFTVKPLVEYFKRLGMELIDVKQNSTKGGSMRCTLQLIGGRRTISNSVQDHIDQELEMGFHGNDQEKLFDAYQFKIDQGKADYKVLIADLQKQNKKIVGYGASATSTTLMYHYDMQGNFDYLVDDFGAKHGLYSPGMHVPVYSSERIYEDRPDVIIVLAWRYFEKIIKRHQEFLAGGGQFIIPLPDIKIIGN